MEADAFRAFERAGWESIPEQYHQAFSELTTQSVAPLLDAARVRAGMRVLDVASGPGYVAAAAAKRGARVVAVDFSGAMVAQARRRYPQIEFQEGDAEALRFPDASFDAVVMNYGLLHLARPEAALAEACRVLRSGAGFAFAVWAPPERTAGFGVVLRAIRKHGNLQVPVPEGPPFFRFGDPAECARSLRSAGFVDPSVATVSQLWRVASPEALFEIMLHSTVRTGALLRAQAPAALQAIREAVREEAAAYRKGAAIELPMPAVLAWARKGRLTAWPSP